MGASYVGLQTTHKLRCTELPQIYCRKEISWLTRGTTIWPLRLPGCQHKSNLANNIGSGGWGGEFKRPLVLGTSNPRLKFYS